MNNIENENLNGTIDITGDMTDKNKIKCNTVSSAIEIYNIAKETYHNNLYSDIGLHCLEYIKEVCIEIS